MARAADSRASGAGTTLTKTALSDSNRQDRIDGRENFVRELFTGRRYGFEHYQREYDWSRTHVGDLLQDLSGRFRAYPQTFGIASITELQRLYRALCERIWDPGRLGLADPAPEAHPARASRAE